MSDKQKTRLGDDDRDIFEKALDDPVGTAGVGGAAVIGAIAGRKLGRKLARRTTQEVLARNATLFNPVGDWTGFRSVRHLQDPRVQARHAKESIKQTEDMIEGRHWNSKEVHDAAKAGDEEAIQYLASLRESLPQQRKVLRRWERAAKAEGVIAGGGTVAGAVGGGYAADKYNNRRKKK